MTTISTKRKDIASANASQENVNHIKKKKVSFNFSDVEGIITHVRNHCDINIFSYER